MKIMVVGATGATGKHLVRQLLSGGHQVKAFVRSPQKLKDLFGNPNLEVIKANALELSDEELKYHVADCDAIASCLGHTQNWKSIYGFPRKLVTDTTSRLCSIINELKPSRPVKFLLMNTAGNSNRDLKEHIPLAQQLILSLIRLLLPPHVDNEKAADHLREAIGQRNQYIEWTAIRPDSLIDMSTASNWKITESPVRSVIFDPGKTSRINVAHFMAKLIDDQGLWEKWKGKMPVIYNVDEAGNLL